MLFVPSNQVINPAGNSAFQYPIVISLSFNDVNRDFWLHDCCKPFNAVHCSEQLWVEGRTSVSKHESIRRE